MWKRIGAFVARFRLWLVLAVLALTVATAPRQVERIGDRLQVALPMLAWGCAAANGKAGEYALRFVAMWVATHGSKHGLGQAEFNIRPNGGDLGFPSGHTSAAAFGASSLVHDCVAGNPVVQGVVIVSAGFVGASRIEADKHDVWQVLFGVLYGWIGDRALRRPSRARTAVIRGLKQVQGWFGALWRRLRAAIRSGRTSGGSQSR